MSVSLLRSFDCVNEMLSDKTNGHMLIDKTNPGEVSLFYCRFVPDKRIEMSQENC